MQRYKIRVDIVKEFIIDSVDSESALTIAINDYSWDRPKSVRDRFVTVRKLDCEPLGPVLEESDLVAPDAPPAPLKEAPDAPAF